METYKRTALVLGAGGFIGSHMVKRLRSEGYWVRGVDQKYPEFSETEANEFIQGDLRDANFVSRVIQFKGYQGNFFNEVPYRLIEPFDEIYQFAADMGGAGFIFTGENDADIMHNSVSINLNVLEEQRKLNETFDGVKKGWTEANRPKLEWKTKIFILVLPYIQNIINLTPKTQIVVNQQHTQQPRLRMDGRNFSPSVFIFLITVIIICLYGLLDYNIFEPEGTWKGGREKAPAAICRKVAYVPPSGGSIEVWGDGKQTRSFLYIDECIEATRRLMDSEFIGLC